MGSLRKKGEKWYGRWYDERGKLHEKSLSKSRREAEQMLRDKESEVSRARRTGLREKDVTQVRLRDLKPPYLADLKARVTERSYTNSKAVLEDVLNRLDVTFVDQLTKRELLRVRDEILALGLSNRTANMRIDRLLAMLRWTEEEDEIDLAIPKVKRLPETGRHARRHRRRLRPTEVCRLLLAARRVDAELGGYPISMFFETILRTGFRFSEAASLTWGDFEPGNDLGWLTVRAEHTKNNRTKRNPVSEAMCQRLEGLRALQATETGRPPDSGDRVFLTPRWTPIVYAKSNAQLQRRLNRVIETAKLKKKDHAGCTIDFHALRHTFATAMVEQDVRMEITAELMGHEDLETTRKIYAEMGRADRRRTPKALDDLWGE